MVKGSTHMKLNKFVNKVARGDAVKIMRQIPDNSIDMAFADPPFNLGKKYSNHDDNKKTDEYLEWCDLWLAEIVRVTKPSGSIFIHNIPKWLTYFTVLLNKKSHFKHWIVWNAGGTPLVNTLLPNHYGILWYTKGQKKYKAYRIRGLNPRCRKCGVIHQDYGGKKNNIPDFGPLSSDVWNDIHRIRHKKRRDKHPCQLPEPLLERLILMSTDKGDIVLDPFMGTGTSAIAAKKLGRKFVGIDIDSKYVAISRRKLKNVKKTKINKCYVSKYLNKVMTIRDKDWKKIKKHYNIPKKHLDLEKTEIVLKRDRFHVL
jgi:site-specific DNA-methyltransferase (adenine-specific)